MIPILCSISADFQNVYDLFAKYSYIKHQLDDTFEMRVNHLDTTSEKQLKGFCTESYFNCKKQHISYLLSFLERYEPNRYIISTDADVIFMKNFTQEIVRNIIPKQHTILVSNDSMNNVDKIPNMGFMILKNCASTKAFLQNLYDRLSIKYTNCANLHRSMQNLVKEYNILLLNNRKFINNNASESFILPMLYNGGCYFHATSTANLYDKAYILSRVMKQIESYN